MKTILSIILSVMIILSSGCSKENCYVFTSTIITTDVTNHSSITTTEKFTECGITEDEADVIVGQSSGYKTASNFTIQTTTTFQIIK
jgi:hypothetical protein